MWKIAAGLLIAAGLSAPAAHAEKTMRIGLTGLSPNLFDPYSNTGLPNTYSWSAVFDGLTVIDDNGAVRPWLAESWENIDPLTWRFKLRPGVVFSDGTPMTAEAVVAVGEFLTDPANQVEVVARMMSFLGAVKAIDPLTVEIRTKVPTPMLPRYLPQFYISQPDQLRRIGIKEFARKPVATGPFVLDDITANKATFHAHTSSWRKPKVDRVELLVVPDAAARRLAVEAGNMEIALQLGPEEAAAIAGGGGRQFTWLDNALWAYHFNQTGGSPYRFAPFNDIRVREALNIAVDRDAIVKTLLDGKTTAATQPAPPSTYGYNPDLPKIPYDPARARKLLAEAGYPDGFRFVLEATVGSNANDAAILQTVAQHLAKIGVTVEIRPISTPQLIRNVMEGTWHEAMFGLMYSHEPTADALRGLSTSSCTWAHPFYCNPKASADMAVAETTFDAAKGLELRHQVMAAYRADWAAIFMYQMVRFAGARAGVSGLKVINNYIYFDELEMR